MKLLNVALIAAALTTSAAGYSQTDSTRNPTDTIRPTKPDTMMLSYGFAGINNNESYVANVTDTIKPDTTTTSYSTASEATTTSTETSTTNVIAQPSAAPVAPHPNSGRHYIPVLGTYVSAEESQEQNRNVMIQVDEENSGKIWIDGLTPEKICAVRKANSGTYNVYKIQSQKVNEEAIPEGTVLYDDNSKEVRICIGRKFVDSNPSEAFNVQTEETVTKKHNRMTEKRAAVISFIGTKTEQGTAKM